MTRFFVVLFASFLAASCAAVRSNVAVTHMLPAGAAKTVAIVPYTENIAMAPDYQANTQKLAAQLRAKGYNVVAAQGGQAPDYLAYFMYRIDNGTPVNQLERPLFVTSAAVSVAMSIITTAPGQNRRSIGVGPTT